MTAATSILHTLSVPFSSDDIGTTARSSTERFCKFKFIGRNRSPTRSRALGGTFSTVDLPPSESADGQSPVEYASLLLNKLGAIKTDRHDYFDNLRRENSAWVNGSRMFLAALVSLALLLTAATAGLRFIPATNDTTYVEPERWMLLAVLMSYALIGAFSIYDRTTDKTAAYFRHVTILLAIRDLWSTLEFAVTKCLAQGDGSSLDASKATKQQLLGLAEAFNKDLNTVTAQEMAEWKTEFVAALSELQQASDKGSGDIVTRLETIAKAAKASADDAAASAKSLEATVKPGMINMTISGDFDGDVVISVDGKEEARSIGKKIAIGNVSSGFRTFRLQAKKGDRTLEMSKILEVKSGIQEAAFELS